MDPIYEIELQDCPYCRGTGTVEDEQGWCVYVTCVDCGAQTAHASYESPEERLAAAQQVAHLWNVGETPPPLRVFLQSAILNSSRTSALYRNGVLPL